MQGPYVFLAKLLWKVFKPIFITMLGELWGESGRNLGGKVLKDILLHKIIVVYIKKIFYAKLQLLFNKKW